ncbi:MAG: MotA/TolQ/ExbB proton channel family protein [Ignavibacteriota bacterium]|nr:MAG: MotA/TolQ/ExbB proton channel family protein [Chlorobiota bacterium]MBE7478249.1 MotA/TolQ/ExbB proton channel family protein [Ignavibacteriales bacterium]MBL1121521.1 MotA/TolQ/ExbB proton channel family protein [Ignavibacteriota bacterium]MCC7094087.1 MotA/TolQ/ExbB proton channel family protein [Ignavibacteriaceae bacterium]MCE7855755.1 MotA/TolQ/ExbB proton channel family protein [Ignavibacteria bacterium CHB3]MEB2295418.1 MotA/TolQ/ExbB proton channel family protein [Ignavibacteri
MNLIEIFLKGGMVMWAILFCSVVALAVAIDRFLILRKAKINVPAFLVRIRGFIKSKDMSGAASYCLREKSPIGNMVRKGLKKFGMGHERVKEAIENAGRQEVSKLEKGLSVLATVAGVAPLLGFLGTVTGMIQAFMRIEDLAGAANPGDLAGGIWEALLTTAFGLIVGIPAYVAYNYFLSAVSKFVSDMETVANDVVDTMQDSTRAVNEFDDEIEVEM